MFFEGDDVGLEAGALLDKGSGSNLGSLLSNGKIIQDKSLLFILFK